MNQEERTELINLSLDGKIRHAEEIIKDAYLFYFFLGTNAINGSMEPLGLIFEHVVAHAALDGVTYQV